VESEFDDLKAALDRYIPDPRPGIEERVLYRVRTAEPRRRYWIWAIPALLLLLVLLMLWPHRVPVVVRVTPPRPLPVVGQALPPARIRTATVRKPVVQPFPTPAPLTVEEKALQALAASRPHEAQHLLAHADDKPIEIPELQIPPLQSDGGQQEHQ
jgi:hypothetical protein